MSDDEQIFAYERLLRDDKFLVICNISDENVIYYYDQNILNSDKLIVLNYNVDKHEDTFSLKLNPWEARIYKI